MEDLIKNVFEQKMKDGTIEKIVSDNLEKMVNDICQSQMYSFGEVGKAMEAKIKPLLLDCVERSDLSSYTTKLTTIVNAALKNSELENYKNLADTLSAICGPKDMPKIEFDQKVKVSEIFKQYVKFVEDEFDESDFDSDEISYDDGKSAYIDCTMEIEEEDKYSWTSDYTVRYLVFDNEKSENKSTTNTKIKVEIDKCCGKLHIRPNTNFQIGDLRRMPKFLVYLMNLSNNFAEIILDGDSFEDSAYFEFEFNYS